MHETFPACSTTNVLSPTEIDPLLDVDELFAATENEMDREPTPFGVDTDIHEAFVVALDAQFAPAVTARVEVTPPAGAANDELPRRYEQPLSGSIPTHALCVDGSQREVLPAVACQV